MNKDFLYKVKSTVIGHAIGDALGVPVEFASRKELDDAPVSTMEENGSHPVPKGSWSDDTSMALATLDSLSKGYIDYEDIMQNFCDWINESKYTPTGVAFDIGRATIWSLISYMRKEAPAIECGQKSELCNGNGSLMRIHPIVLFLADKDLSIDEKIEIVHNASSLTHAHERSKVACGIYAFLLWELLKNPTKDGIVEAMRKSRAYYDKSEEKLTYNRLWLNIGRGYYLQKESSLYPKLTRDDIKSSGYVVDTFEAALWCLINTNSYKDCVLMAVNLGDDTDTVGAIAGGLAGAMYGYDNIPEDWKNTLLKREYIEKLCEGIC